MYVLNGASTMEPLFSVPSSDEFGVNTTEWQHNILYVHHIIAKCL